MSPQYKIGEPKLIEKANCEKYALCRIPGMVLAEKDTLLLYYECRSSVSDWAEIDLKVIRSTDGGESFETVLLIEGKGDTLNNPVMTVKDGEVHFLFLKNYNRLFYSKSTDDGLTFSEPIDISCVLDAGERYTVAAVGPGHGIVHDGKIIVPIWFGYNPDDPKAHHPSDVRTLYSEDDGKTWNLGDVIGRGTLTDANESALAVTPEGEVIISIRHCTEEKPYRAVSVSKNGYSNWSPVTFRESLPDPRCMGSMYTYGDSVYHVNCATATGRRDLTLKRSADNFETCESTLISYLAGYSDIAVSDKYIYIFFERDVLHKNDPENNDGLYLARLEK